MKAILEKMKSGIYILTSPSGKKYIGQSVNLQRRKCAFFRFGVSYGGQKIDCARKKYNHKSLWDYKVLEYCSINELDERERHYISLYDTINNGYNCESGGNKNKEISEETRKKMSDVRIGKTLSIETKKKMSDSAVKGEKHKWYGVHKYGKDSPHYGHKANDETIAKLRASHIGKVQTKETIKKRVEKLKKPIIQYTKEGAFVMEWDSIKSASEELNIGNTLITKCCKHITKSAGGYIWKYK